MAKLDLMSGPVTANLDVALRDCGIKVQAYYSRRFVGSHCDKYLKPITYTAAFDTVVDKARELSKKPLLINKAFSTAEEFKGLFGRFADVHKFVSHGRVIRDCDIPKRQ